MPTYGYECKSCGYTFDAFQSMREDPLTSCPQCGKGIRRLINGGTGIIFKGSGFYVNERSGKSAAKDPSKGDTPKTAKPPAAESAPCPGCAKAESCPKAANE
jgi:putative FmdB family regulatory protein